MVTPAAGRAVYVVDDDDAALDSLLMLLTAEGLPAVGFSSPQEFLKALPEGRRGCLITDLRRPEMDGVELIRTLRDQGVILPVIVITGHADVTKAVDAMKA